MANQEKKTRSTTEQPTLVGELQIEHDIAWIHREWRAERAVWLLFAMLLLAALLGVFGEGLLSSTSVERGGMRAAYERFVREGSPSEIVLSVPVESGTASFALKSNSPILIEVSRIDPEPDSQERLSDGAIRYTLSSDENSDRCTVVIRYQMTRAGKATTTVTQSDRRLVLDQFVYP